MNIYSFFFLTLLIAFPPSSLSAKILFFSACSTYSHRLLFWPLIQKLAENGHEVTFLSPSPPKKQDENKLITDFVPNGLLEFYKGDGIMNMNLLHARLRGELQDKWEEMPDFGALLCKIVLGSSDVKEWANSTKFDLIFIDGLFNECAYGLVHKHRAKHIVFSTSLIFTWSLESLGLLPESSWIPDFIKHFPGVSMTFYQKLITTIEVLRWHFIRKFRYLPQIEETIRTELGLNDMRSILEMENEMSFYFTNTHLSEEYARSLPPHVLPLGGIHIKEGLEHDYKNLPQDILSFTESNKRGFIYVSFGTDAKISTLPEEILSGIFSALGESGFNVIWRWDGDLDIEVPSNIILLKWVDQQKLLSHPLLKVFIAHGGLLSMHEAIHYKVPLIVLPIFGEQDYNGERVERKGFGLNLEISTLTKAQLSDAIREITSNPKYKEKVKEVSIQFQDRIVKPLDAALWYTEFVLRHNNTNFMKPHTIHQNWYERRLLDVWAFILISLFILHVIFMFILLKTIVYITKSLSPLLVHKNVQVIKSKVN